MSDTPAISRTLGGADEFERRMRATGQSGSGQDDPLSELARLVGKDDPFRNGFPKGGVVKTDPAKPAGRPADAAAAARDFPSFDRAFRGAFDAGEESGAPDDPAVVRPPAIKAPAYELRSAASYQAVSSDGRRAIEPSPDRWAQGHVDSTPEPDTAPPVQATREVSDAKSGSSSRTLIVLAAVVVLTGGGLAASFLARPNTVSATAGTVAPTIMAATGPNKVEPETPATDADAPSQNSTLLDKNKGDGTATAKVVDTTEQPVDLNQAVKAAPAAVPEEARPVQASSPFPEPKKVKVVIVRPDGSVIANPTDATGANRAADLASLGIGQDANLAFDKRTSLPIVTPDTPPAAPVAATPATPKPATPKTTARVATTPKPALASADTPPVGTSPAAKPPVTRAPAKPAEVASAAPAPAADTTASTGAAGGGAYAVQLGAPPSEQEAHDVAARLQKKFAEQLGSYRATVHKADSGSKSVYRIRIGNLSRDDAKALCSKLQAGGGNCFVAKN